MNKQWMRNFAADNPNTQGVDQLEASLKDAPDMKVLAVTGTVGKTTVMEMLYEYLILRGHKVMMVGTNGIYCNHSNYAHQNFPSTSPTSQEMLFLFMLGAYSYQCDYFLIEVTAETMYIDVYDEIEFESLSIVNIKRDVVKSFRTDDDYINAKQTLLLNNTIHHIICNRDANEYYNIILNNPNLITYNPYPPYQLYEGRVVINVCGRNIVTNLHSSINLQNIACFINTIYHLNMFDPDLIEKTLSQTVTAGRLEHFVINDRIIVVDTYYGGVAGLTPYLEETANLYPRTISVLSSYYFGTEHDKHTDIVMHRQGRAALVNGYSDEVVLCATMARRGKDPSLTREQVVLDHLLKGAPGATVIYNRLQALKHAWTISQPGDRILILGMGTETWGKIKDTEIGDREVIQIIAREEN